MSAAGELAFTIVLCSRNRAHLLESALPSIAAIDYPRADFELVLVDNGSGDATPDVAARFAAGADFAVRVVREETLGLSAARNRGIREARGRLLFFTDDDQLVDPAILREHERVTTQYGVRVVQGNIALQFPEGRPPWLRGELETVLGRTQDVAEGPARIDLYGGNMCFRREIFDPSQGLAGGFREDLGKGRVGYAEDTDITRRLRARGEVIAYAPGATVFHVIQSDRTSTDFFRSNSWTKGRSDGRLIPRRRLPIEAVRAVGQGALEGGRALLSRARHAEHETILAETRAANAIGRLLGMFSGVRSPAKSAP
jgi:GT2 family glycosyltransferase